MFSKEQVVFFGKKAELRTNLHALHLDCLLEADSCDAYCVRKDRQRSFSVLRDFLKGCLCSEVGELRYYSPRLASGLLTRSRFLRCLLRPKGQSTFGVLRDVSHDEGSWCADSSMIYRRPCADHLDCLHSKPIPCSPIDGLLTE